MRAAQPTYASVLHPQQLLVAVPMGDSKLVHGMRVLMELNPGWVLVRIDLKNAYNLIRRSAVLRRHLASPALRHLVPYLRAELAPCSRLRVGAAWLDSDEGVQQGWPLSTAAFCATIQPEVEALDQRLWEAGRGCARFGADDGFIAGPPAAVWPALVAFVADLEAETGCRLATGVDKCQAWAGAAVRDEAFRDAPAWVSQGRHAATRSFGVRVFNVPLGDPAYIASDMRGRGEEVDGVHRVYADKLHLHPAWLWCLAQRSLQHKPTYWLRNMPPLDVAAYCSIVDGALLRTVQLALGVEIVAGSLAADRLRLPARALGCGLRFSTDTCAAAYIGAFGEVLPTFVDHTSGHGEPVPGVYHDLMAPIIGASSFAPQGSGFGPFLASGLPSAASLTATFLGLQVRLQALGEGHLLSGDMASLDPAACRQKAITALCDTVAVAGLGARFRGLPAASREARLWPQLDSFSSSWVTLCPGRFSADQFREIVAAYLLLPSPSLVGRAGGRFLHGASGASTVCDVYGDSLCCAHLMGGDGAWGWHHDGCNEAVHAGAVQAGIRARMEPTGLFEGLAQPGRDSRSGSVRPDMEIFLPRPAELAALGAEGVRVKHLVEVKTLHYSARNPKFRAGASSRAVDMRAAEVATAWRTHLRAADREHYPDVVGVPGPFQLRGASFPYHVLVFGPVGEVSMGVLRLLQLVAAQGADAWGRATGARSVEAASSSLLGGLICRVASAAWRGRADVLLGRVGKVIGPLGPGAGGLGLAFAGLGLSGS
jgi:hypothetical protein